MVKDLSQKVVEWQIRRNMLQDKERNIYIYAYEVMIGEVVNILITCIIAAIFRYPLIFVFLIVYIPLRSYAGGYHANNSERCMVFSAITLLMVCIVGKYLLNHDQIWFLVIGEALAGAVVLLLAPVEDQNKPLDGKEVKRYRKCAYLIALAEIAIAIALYLLNQNEIGNMIIIAHIVMASMLIVGKVKNIIIARRQSS